MLGGQRMLKHYNSLCRTIVFLICALFVCGNAFALGEMKKAKKLMDSEEYTKAIALLEKRIDEKPEDAEAHFNLGICYIKIENISRAEEWFTQTVALDSQYGNKP